MGALRPRLGGAGPAGLRGPGLDRPRRQMQPIAARQWSAGILPSKFQGVKINSFGDPVLHIDNPQGISAKQQGESIDTINA